MPASGSDSEEPLTSMLVSPAQAGTVAVHGDPDAALVLVGHSHNLALWKAAEAGDGPWPLAWCQQVNYAHTPVEPMWDFLVEHAPGRIAVVCFRGNETVAHLMFQTTPPTRLVGVSAAGDDTTDAIWIPRSMYRAVLARYNGAPLANGLSRLAAVARRVVLVGTPQPKRDEHVRNAIKHEPHFVKLLAELSEDPDSIALKPESERVEHWRMNQALYAEAAQSAGVPFVPSPAEAADGDGMLRPEYGDWDVGHGSAAYGALMWQAIEPHLDGVRLR